MSGYRPFFSHLLKVPERTTLRTNAFQNAGNPFCPKSSTCRLTYESNPTMSVTRGAGIVLFASLTLMGLSMSRAESNGTLFVVGQGQVSAEPNMATVSLSVSSTNDTASDARERAAELTKATLTSIRGISGINRTSDIKTTDINVNPQMVSFRMSSDIQGTILPVLFKVSHVSAKAFMLHLHFSIGPRCTTPRREKAPSPGTHFLRTSR